MLTRLRAGVIARLGCVGLCLAGCADSSFQVRAPQLDEADYVRIYPYYFEFCAVSEFDKKKGIGIDIDSGGPGGHSVFYLNGACRVADAHYPQIALCDDAGGSMLDDGVGISVNDHFSSAKWVATQGRSFFYNGDLAPGEPLTQQSYARTQARAKAMGILDGVVFHQRAVTEKPANMAVRDYMYDVSAATDYAIGFGRDRYCARVPLDRARMARVVDYLNAQNLPYRTGEMIFEWDVLRDNCAHLAHNALTRIGLWPLWPTDRPLLVSAFDFPVPKNEFVNLMRQTNDMPIEDPTLLYDDPVARAALLDDDLIATQPGALAEAVRAVGDNALYNTSHLRLIFYDEPVFGHYQQDFDRIFAEPRYTDLARNIAYFADIYDRILARPDAPPADADRAAFDRAYRAHIARAAAQLATARRVLSAAR